MTELYANDANSTLAGAITSTATSAALSPGSGVLFPAVTSGSGNFFRMTFRDAATMLLTEIVYVTNVTGDVVTLTRAQEGTTAQAWSAGDIVANLNTAGAMGALTQLAVLPTLLTGLIGDSRNLVGSVPSAGSASTTFTADMVVVGTALNGLQYLLTSYNQTLNTAATGAGGMDTGSIPANSFLGIYAIYNPTTKTASILGTSAASAVLPTIYAAGHMPTGYTASALISVVRTGTTALFAFSQFARRIFIPALQYASGAGVIASFTAISLATAVPKNAKTFSGNFNVNINLPATISVNLAGDASGTGEVINGQTQTGTGSQGNFLPHPDVPILTAQTTYVQVTITAGTSLAWNLQACQYSI